MKHLNHFTHSAAPASVLVTGGAGFIGSHLVDQLLREGAHVTVIDNIDTFYDPRIKRSNIAAHHDYAHYRLVEADIRDLDTLRETLTGEYEVVVHLAGRAGVRPSLEAARLYQEVNVGGTQNLLELARMWGVRQFVFGSSSSVYGINERVPWREEDHVLLPISPYASTKVSGELLGHVYSHLYGIRFIALRFFTAYGPRQRPDLAIHKFTRLMLAGEPLTLFGDGKTRRDYTYISDIVAGVRAAMQYTDSEYEVINLGSGRPVELLELVETLEDVLGVQAARKWLPEQPGEVPQTWADIRRAKSLLGYEPSTGLRAGLEAFREWLVEQPAASVPLKPPPIA